MSSTPRFFNSFNQLPAQFNIQSSPSHRILYLTDPSTFTSLILVSSAWRNAAQTPHLYAYHLSRCPSFAINNNIITGPFTDESLKTLKRQLLQEVKRNLFEAYLRPRRTTISFISTTTSSSASFPGGEAFDFTFSPNGHWTLALSSSRIYVIDTVSPRISVQRELKVRRRPVSATILDDGSILAVLSNEHQVNIYELSNLKLDHLRSISLDNRPTTIALSPKGEVLATAYEGGIEVHSLATNALSSDRRAVKCESVDSLAFSHDGTMLLGSIQSNKGPNTVILTVPFLSEGSQQLSARETLCQMWTEPILFPNSSRDCSHATLLPNHHSSDTVWTFAFDRVFESFRAVRTDDLRNGQTYFTGPKPPRGRGASRVSRKLIPSTSPAATSCGQVVAAGFGKKDIWLYGIPENLDMSQGFDTGNSPSIVMAGSNLTGSAGRSSRSSASYLTRGDSAEMARMPRWQIMVDKYRNVFSKGHLIGCVPGATAMRWATPTVTASRVRSIGERLIIVAPGGVTERSPMEDGEFGSADGGRVVILDFDISVEDGKNEETTIELGDAQPEDLPEGNIDIEAEVALVRKRTVRGMRDPAKRASVVDALTPADAVPPVPALQSASTNDETQAVAGSTEDRNQTSRDQHNSSPPDGLTLEEASAAFDGPYSHTAPRSRTSLLRSATAVAANRQRNPPPPRIVDSGRVQYRRPDGRGELPHESDADNWVPPPPPYSAKADAPLPEHLQKTLMPRSTVPISSSPSIVEQPHRASTVESPRIERRPVSSSLDRILPESSDNSSVSPPPTIAGNPSQESPSVSRSNTVSPLSSMMRFDGVSTPSPRRTSSTSTVRRPVSAIVGRFSSPRQQAKIARLGSPISPVPEPLSRASSRASISGSISLPSSPITTTFRPQSTGLTLSGANLQSRLDYPLPPAPPREHTPTSPRRPTTSHRPEMPDSIPHNTVDEIERIAAGMPSAQQLANLNDRHRSPSISRSSRPGSRGPSTLQDAIIPAPPRGALGAAGNRPSSRAEERRRSSIVERNSFAASSPALLRPTPRRLDTIQSVSSFLSSHSRAGLGSRNGRGEISNVQQTYSEADLPINERAGSLNKPKRSIFGSKKARPAEYHHSHESDGKRKKRSGCIQM